MRRFGAGVPLTTRTRITTPELADALDIDLSPSSLVNVDTTALAAMIAWVDRNDAFFRSARLRWDDPKYWNTDGSQEERSQFFAIGNAINFRFWRLEEGRFVPCVGVLRGEHLRGSMYMWRALRICLEERRRPVLEAAFLASLSESDFDAVYSVDLGVNPLTAAREERIKILRDLGTVLQRRWEGNFLRLVCAAEGSLVAFVRLSREIRAFDDPLCKLTMVNAILHSGSAVTTFDADPLPGIDYHLVKQLLRHGVLRPKEALRSKLVAGQILSSDEGMELRRMALHAFIEVSRVTGMGGEALDNAWWGNKSNCKDRGPICEDVNRRLECPFVPFCSRLTAIGLPLEDTRYY
jgi:hypothetical protein